MFFINLLATGLSEFNIPYFLDPEDGLDSILLSQSSSEEINTGINVLRFTKSRILSGYASHAGSLKYSVSLELYFLANSIKLELASSASILDKFLKPIRALYSSEPLLNPAVLAKLLKSLSLVVDLTVLARFISSSISFSVTPSGRSVFLYFSNRSIISSK